MNRAVVKRRLKNEGKTGTASLKSLTARETGTWPKDD